MIVPDHRCKPVIGRFYPTARFSLDVAVSQLEAPMVDAPKDTAFSDESRDDDSGKTDVLFNSGSEDGADHGHVVTSDDGETTNYARDTDGTVYVDDSQDDSK
jgi:hypothetical protein